ncbi:TetR-family transcriptional regulator [Bifidobacterium ramosum]|uniref:TetR-family transcriptional regulator n=2 Tax=Bifidobacterium ramosum TaxID=1798158 RepID=A0A6L4X4I6_9BIFI|nr:TetR/AcrR family transcriptional regulator [Bifidobacterium ramosum]KAB8289453.1 TetR-family transcriptional regulator [Bifidobacterium ramosum]
MADRLGGGVEREAEGRRSGGGSRTLLDQRGISLKATATRMRWQRRKRDETRRTIRETAMRLFAQHGYAAVTVRRIADEAGVSTITLFRYFPAKEDLIFGFDLDGEPFAALRRVVSSANAATSAAELARHVASGTFGAISQAQADGLMAWLRVVRSDATLTAGLYARIPQWTDAVVRMVAGDDRRGDGRVGRDAQGDDVNFALRMTVTLVVAGAVEVLLEWERRCATPGDADLGTLLSVASDACALL